MKMKSMEDFYNATAADWADKWYLDETMLPLLEKFINLFEVSPRILDAGCGAGYESMRLFQLGAEVVGVDISEKSIELARLKNPNCRFEIMDCTKLDEKLGVFDGIVSIALLVHIEDSKLQSIFNNFKKIIKQTGFLFVAFVGGQCFDEKRSFVEVNGEKYNRAFYLHQVNRVIKAAKEAGFEYLSEWFLNEPLTEWKYLVFQVQ